MRPPFAAGSFYPESKDELVKLIDLLFKQVDASKVKEAEKGIAFVAPHAGYIYSGYVAAYTYLAIAERVKKTGLSTFVIIGPDHNGSGDFVNVSLDDFETPLGVAKNDRKLSELISGFDKRFSTSKEEIAEEHSVEVQIPFLQRLFPQAQFCFICMTDQSIEASKIVSNAIDHASGKLGRDVLVIASSDFDHYEPASVAESKDMPAIHALERLDELGFNKQLAASGDTACGYGAITSALLFAKGRGATKGLLLKYGNSGEATKDYSSVVAYASIAFL
ncbi:MAG: AmmeMemoRadiSam system protein B [Candidatus Micrarchaeia archaeon]